MAAAQARLGGAAEAAADEERVSPPGSSRLRQAQLRARGKRAAGAES